MRTTTKVQHSAAEHRIRSCFPLQRAAALTLSLVASVHAKKELPNLEKVTETFRRYGQVQIYSRVTHVQIVCCIHGPIQAKDEPLNGTFLDILLNTRTDLLLVESEHPVI